MNYGIALIVPLILSLIVFPQHIKLMMKLNKFGIDIHKETKPKVAEMGGIVLLLIMLVSIGVIIILSESRESKLFLFIFLLTVIIAGVIGIIDDIHPLSAKIKPLLLLLAAIPIIISHLYSPHPILPFVGETRLTIVYLILLPFAISVTANATNMLDVYNGSMASTTMIMLVAIFISNIIVNNFRFSLTSPINIIIIITFSATAGFWFFNKYPAKVFAGDSGSLSIGAALGAIAILGKLEVVVIIIMIPLIMNSFGIISSVRGLKERREMKVRPTSMTDDWKLKATIEPNVPITLAGLVLKEGPLTEKDVVKGFNILTIASSLLGILTAVLIWITKVYFVS